MPTVLLVVTQGFAARYLLRTGILRELRGASAKVVVLTPNADEEYLQAEFEDEGIVLEPLRAELEIAKRSKLWWLLYHLRSYSLGQATRSPAFMTKYAGFRRRTAATRPFAAACIHVAVQGLWRSRRLRRAIVDVEARLFRDSPHADVFDRHQPDVVVATGLGYAMPDAVVLREAARRGISTAVAISGWDNPSSKGYGGADVDRVFAWSERMADQLVDFQDVPRRRIAVEGVAHFDRYVTPDALLDRAALCAEVGLDPARRIILFATSTPGAYAHNADVLRGLIGALDAGRFGQAQIVVRVHPIFFRSDQSPPLAEFHALCDHPLVHLDEPEVVSHRLRCDLADSDNTRFSSLIVHCDVLACFFSTTTLEAFLTDRPVVYATWNAHLDAPPAGPEDAQPDGDPQRPWDQFVHLRPLVAGGAVPVANSLPQLVDAISATLENPDRGAAERSAFARAECGPTDGRAGARIAEGILALAPINARRPSDRAVAAPAGV